MYAAYSVLIVTFFVVMSPYLAWQALRYRKYIRNLRQRLRLPPDFVQPRRGRIDLDPRGLGRRSAHRARAAARSSASAIPGSGCSSRRRR